MKLEKLRLNTRKKFRVVKSTKELEDKRIICDIPELKNLIYRWAENDGWKYSHFADFLESTGLKAPFNLYKVDLANDSFKCDTASKETFTIEFVFGEDTICNSIIYLINDEQRVRYEISSNHNDRNGNTPRILSKSISLDKENKELSIFNYQTLGCDRRLLMDKFHILDVGIGQINSQKEQKDLVSLMKKPEVEKYLLGLEYSPDFTNKVYHTLFKEILGLSDNDISNCNFISVLYGEYIKHQYKIRSGISLKNGKMQEYAILEDGQTYHVKNDGKWEYFNDNITISGQVDQFVISITCKEEAIKNINMDELVSRVKEKISNLMKIVE